VLIGRETIMGMGENDTIFMVPGQEKHPHSMNVRPVGAGPLSGVAQKEWMGKSACHSSHPLLSRRSIFA
jgi:hypothetical protein